MPTQNTRRPGLFRRWVGAVRALLYNHYVVLKKKHAPGVTAFAQQVQPEGGGGDYGPNSGGFDQLGYGTLVYALKPLAASAQH